MPEKLQPALLELVWSVFASSRLGAHVPRRRVCRRCVSGEVFGDYRGVLPQTAFGKDESDIQTNNAGAALEVSYWSMLRSGKAAHPRMTMLSADAPGDIITGLSIDALRQSISVKDLYCFWSMCDDDA